MMRRLGMFVVFPLTTVCLAIFCPFGAIQAAPTEKKPESVAPASPKPVAPVNVNVTVNVRVSHDTKVDVRIEAPFTPVIGSLQLPDFVQRFVGGFFKTSDAPTTKSLSPNHEGGVPRRADTESPQGSGVGSKTATKPLPNNSSSGTKSVK